MGILPQAGELRELTESSHVLARSLGAVWLLTLPVLVLQAKLPLRVMVVAVLIALLDLQPDDPADCCVGTGSTALSLRVVAGFAGFLVTPVGLLRSTVAERTPLCAWYSDRWLLAIRPVPP